MNYSMQSVQLSEVTLAIWETPKKGRPTLLCVHGGPGLDSATLKNGLQELQDHFDLILVDLRGHGKSSLPKKNDYSLEAYSKDIHELVNKLNLKKPVGIFGHSFGGPIAIKTLATYQGDFSFGILCNSPLDGEYRKTSLAATQKHINDLNIDEMYMRFDSNNSQNNAYKQLMLDLGPLYFPELKRNEIAGVMSEWDFKVAPFSFATTHIMPTIDTKNDCKNISVPILVIGSKQDDLITSSHVVRFKEYLKSCTIKSINGGHFPFITHKSEFCSEVSQWWEIIKKENKL